MGSLGEERDRVGEVPANALDHRKAAEDQQRDEQPMLTRLARVVMPAAPMPVLVGRMRTVARVVIRVVVIMMPVRRVMLVRVRHGLRRPWLGEYT